MKDCSMSSSLRDPILVLLASLVAHDHFRPSTIGQAVVIAALCATHCYNLYLNSKKEKPVNEEVKKELAELRQAVNSVKLTKVFAR
jgi:hypothetical protein